jgi:uridine phosphorylase
MSTNAAVDEGIVEYPPSELILDHGKIYHLDLTPEMVADKVILVGDPDRVAVVASFFDSIESSTSHREFTSKTGYYRGKRILVLSTGIGVGNIDITVNELDSLVNIDFPHRRHKEKLRSLEIVRIGTCGLLQPELPIHSYVVSEFACGLDNIAHFYDVNYSDEEIALNAALSSHISLPGTISTYATQASPDLFERLSSSATYAGITITSSGFYGPQGRQLRMKTHTTELNDRLQLFQFPRISGSGPSTLRVTNFEMESSALFALGKALGHRCATICLGKCVGCIPWLH